MFKWFRKQPPRTLLHNELGPLTDLGHGLWTADYIFGPTRSSITIFVEDNVDALSAAPATIREFARRYDGLKPSLAMELRELLRPWQPEPLESGEAVLDRFELVAIDLDGSPFPVVEFSLKQGWDDAGFRVGLDDWIPKGLGVDD